MQRFILSLAIPLVVLTVPARTAAGRSVNLLAVDTVSPSSGWGITEHSVMWTADGGHHWTVLLPSFGPKTVSLPPVLSVRSARVAWVVAPLSPVAGGSLPMSRVFSTTDGGRHWRRSPALRGFAVNIGVAGASGFTSTDTHHAWLLTSEGAAMSQADFNVYRTTDGATWRRIAYGRAFQVKNTGALP